MPREEDIASPSTSNDDVIAFGDMLYDNVERD